MGRGSAGLFAAVLALAGCKSTTDPKPIDRNPNGTTTGRGKDSKEPKGPTWIDPTARLPGTNTSVPKAGSWNDPKNPNFDAKAEAQDGVGGKVVDVFNRPAKNIFIRVEAVNDPPGATAKGIYTDGNGYFFTRGLKSGSTYNLTAEASQDGKQLVGTVQVRVPNPVLTIILRDGLGLPPPVPAGTGERPVEGFPPPPVPSDSDRIPPPGFAPIGPSPSRPSDGAFSPGGGASNPVPATIGGSPSPRPSGPIQGTSPLTEPDDLTLPVKPSRPENVADGPRNPFTPPVANIPAPPVPSMPSPPAVDPKQPRGRGTSFRLLDPLERNWDFATDKSGSVVLVEFVTTICPNCKPAIPVLKEMQSRYGGSGLQIVAVLCDEVPQKQRAAAAAKYSKDNGTNYPVFVEPGAEPGAVRDTFGVESYPRAVLLDSQGRVLWNGHPAKKAEMEAAVKKALGK